MSERVVSADWLAARLEEVAVVDVREPWEYEGIGHVPRAVNVPFDAIRADAHATATGEGRGMLPGGAAFAETMGAVGLTRADHVVAYDDHHGVFAARFLVTAELYGHPAGRLHLLDGDFSAWSREHETTTAVPAPAEAVYEVAPPAETPLVDAAAVDDALGDPATVVVDVREPEEYAEGHIPGAVQLDWRELVDAESRGLRSRAEIEDLLAGRGITPDRRVLLYCNTARRISHTYVVLRHLGYGDVGFYEGSLTEWEAAGRPVEAG